MIVEPQEDIKDVQDAPETPRDIDTLLDLDYSEMTTEEIEIVIEYKVGQRVKSEEFRVFEEATKKNIENRREIYEQEAAHSRNLLDTLTANALNAYENAS